MTNGFIATNQKKKIALMPTEDSFSIDSENEIFAVADGITRDPYEFLPDMKTLKGKINFATKLLAAMRNAFGGHQINGK